MTSSSSQPRGARAAQAFGLALVASLFASAFLLFAVEPLLGKRILPWFGGSPATWTACMLFFQAMLFVGYALADLAIRRLPLRVQPLPYLGLLLLASLGLPLGPWPRDRPLVLDHPAQQVLALLASRAGAPYLALAVSAPLLQHWYERVTKRSPYALYAASNVGSLFGLLAYPLLIEPALDLDRQARVWSWAFALYALAIAFCALPLLRTRAERAAPLEPSRVGSGGRAVRWFVLSFLPSVLLLAVTNYITVDVAPMPFLWVAPLALYLGSFVLTFGNSRLSSRRLFLPLWVGCTALLGIALFEQGSAGLGQQLGIFLTSLFVGCTLCHGELVRAQPPPAQLSRFFLFIAAGGASGGAFVALLAPLVFRGFYELQLAVIGIHAALCFVIVTERTDASPSERTRRDERRVALRFSVLGLGLSLPLIVATLWVQTHDRTRNGRVIEQRRSFYGVLRVTELSDVRMLSHGRIRHGMQFRDPARADQPTMYFGPESGVGRALRLHALDHPRRIGVVGLGVGTLAHYGRASDSVRFYELSPDVVEIARTRFSFLARSAARIEIAVGDGRLALEREPPQHFDLLVLDAFSSDSVPVHLLTREAFAIDLKQLRPDGILLANVSNRHLAVERVVAGSAARYGLALRLLETPSDPARGYARVRWALMARDGAELDRVLSGVKPSALRGEPVLWTDAFSNLLEVLR